MIYTLPIAVCLLVLLLHLSIQTLIIPLAFGYLLFLYGLNDLPKSKETMIFIVLGIIGLIISFVPIDLLWIQELIITIVLILFTIRMDKESIYVVPTTTAILLSLYVGHFFFDFVTSIYAWFASLITLTISTYYFYQFLNQYLQDHETIPLHTKHKEIPNTLKIILIIIILISSIFAYQEYHFLVNEPIYDYMYYTIEDNEYDIKYTIPPISIYNFYDFYQRSAIHSSLQLPAFLYEYNFIEVSLSAKKDLYSEEYRFEKKQTAPTKLEEDYFFLNETDYDCTMRTVDPDVQTRFETNDPMTLTIIAYNDFLYSDGDPLQINLNILRHDALYQGRSLFTKAQLAYDGRNTNYENIEIVHSIYLRSILEKTEHYHYEILEISKEDKLISTLCEETTEPYDSITLTQTVSFFHNEALDFENNDYQLNLTLSDENNKILYETEVMLK